jgi:hypothetical protein
MLGSLGVALYLPFVLLTLASTTRVERALFLNHVIRTVSRVQRNTCQTMYASRGAHKQADRVWHACNSIDCILDTNEVVVEGQCSCQQSTHSDKLQHSSSKD